MPPSMSAAEPSDSQPSEPVIDGAIDLTALALLDQLDPGGRQGVVGRILQTYQRSLQRAIDDLAAARAVGDLAGIGRLVHKLRSASASIGALPLSQACRAIEEDIRESRTADIEVALQALQNESVRVRTALAAILADRGSPP